MEDVKAASDEDGILERCAVEVTTVTGCTTCVHVEDELHAQTKAVTTSETADDSVENDIAEPSPAATDPAIPPTYVHPYVGSIVGKGNVGKDYADMETMDRISAKTSDEQPGNEEASGQSVGHRSVELSSMERPDVSFREGVTSSGSAQCVVYCEPIQQGDGKIDKSPSLTNKEMDRFQVENATLPKVNVERENDSPSKHIGATAVAVEYLAHHSGFSRCTDSTSTKSPCTSSTELEKSTPETADSTIDNGSLPQLRKAAVKKSLDLGPMCSDHAGVRAGSPEVLDNRGHFNKEREGTGSKDLHSARAVYRPGQSQTNTSIKVHDAPVARSSLSVVKARKHQYEYIQRPRLGCHRRSESSVLDKFDHNEDEKGNVTGYFGYYFDAHEAIIYGAPIQLSAGSQNVWDFSSYWPQIDMYGSYDHSEPGSNSKPSAVKSSAYKKKKNRGIQANDWNKLDNRRQCISLSHLDVHTRDYLQRLEFFHQLDNFQAQNREQYIQYQEYLQQKARARLGDGEDEQITQLEARSQVESSLDTDPHADRQ